MSEGIDKQTEEVAAMAEPWPLIDALSGGTFAMRKAGKRFLPPFQQEDSASYADRLNSSVLFPAFARTTEVLSARPLARPLQIEGVSKIIKDLFSNIDMMGTDLHAFSGQVMLNCLRYGLHGVMVDAPKSEGVRTKADEKAAGIRPYLAHYPCASILGWEATHSAQGHCISQIRLKEVVTERTGRFTTESIEQIRVLEPGSWEVWRKDQNSVTKEWALFESGATTINTIPFVFFYGLREAFGIGKPPLLELAHMNVEHFQSASDQQNLLHVARVPILFARGFGTSDKITVGAKSVTTAKDEKADLKYVEHSGEAIGAGSQSIKDLEDRMRQVGAELLTERAGEVTATQVNSEDENNSSTLQKIVEEFEDSLEACLKLMALWVGETTEPVVKLHKDFGGGSIPEVPAGDRRLSADEPPAVVASSARV